MWSVLDKLLTILITFFKVVFKIISLVFTGIFSIIQFLSTIVLKIFEFIFSLFKKAKNKVGIKKQEEEYQRQLDES